MPLHEELERQGAWLFKHRGSLPLILLLTGTILYLRSEQSPETFFLEEAQSEGYFETFCLIVSLIGTSIRVYTVGHSPRNTSGRNVNFQLADALNTTGMYSIVRHPLYLGNFFMWSGPAMIAGNFWFFVAFCFFFWIYYERIMFTEEQFLRRKFGAGYVNWAEKVPLLIPRFRGFIRPSTRFNWKKALRQEKTGLAAVFLIFCSLDIAGEWIENESNYRKPLLLAGGIIIFIFILLKVLEKTTVMFETTEE